jgi:hypothetical protein
VACQPTRSDIGGTRPVEVILSERRLPPGMFPVGPVALHVVAVPLMVQVISVSAPSARSVIATEFPLPGAAVDCTAKSRALMFASGDRVSASLSARVTVEIPVTAAYRVPVL